MLETKKKKIMKLENYEKSKNGCKYMQYHLKNKKYQQKKNRAHVAKEHDLS